LIFFHFKKKLLTPLNQNPGSATANSHNGNHS
jgi:hypothetical protein